MTTVVRRAAAGDLSLLLELVAEYCAADHHHFDADVARSGLVPLLEDDTYGAIWLIDPHDPDPDPDAHDPDTDPHDPDTHDRDAHRDRPAGRPVSTTADGYIVVTWGWSIEIGGLDVVLDEFYVRSRRAGKGSDALAVVEAACRERGVKRIFLETELANTGARRLYERHGYTADSSIWMSKELT